MRRAAEIKSHPAFLEVFGFARIPEGMKCGLNRHKGFNIARLPDGTDTETVQPGRLSGSADWKMEMIYCLLTFLVQVVER